MNNGWSPVSSGSENRSDLTRGAALPTDLSHRAEGGLRGDRGVSGVTQSAKLNHNGPGLLAAAGNGTIVYVDASSETSVTRTFAWVDRRAARRPRLARR